MAYIYIEEGIEKYPKGREILEKLSHFLVVSSEAEFLTILKNKKLSFTQEKEYWFIGVKKGKFVKPYYLDDQFEAIQEEYILTYENNCPMNCYYCYLRDYYQDGAIRYYVNFESMFEELDLLESGRVSCGIMNDSLVLESITGTMKTLLEYFEKRPSLILEIRSKHGNVDALLQRKALKNVEVAFTFSPSEVVTYYEPKTSPLHLRIKAAKEAQEHGYHVGLRFDPLIYHEGFKVAQEKMIHEIFETLDPLKISNIGIGTIRFRKELKQKVLSEISTDLFTKNYITGLDGKLRYYKPIRIALYKHLIELIKKHGEFTIYLGMEPKYIWDEVLP